MPEQANIDISDRFYLQDDKTCIGLEDYISHADGVLVCSFEGTLEDPHIDRYWYEERSTIENLTRCPLTRKHFKYTFIKNMPADILREIQSDSKLSTDNAALKTALDHRHAELPWESQRAETAIDFRVNELINAGGAANLQGLNRDLILYYILRYNVFRANSVLRLKLIAEIFLNLLKITYELPLCLLILTGLTLFGTLITLAGIFTLNLKAAVAGFLITLFVPFAILAYVNHRVTLACYGLLYTASLPISLVAEAIKSISDFTHQKIRTKNINEAAEARVNPQELTDDDIKKIVSNYHSQFRKRHSTLTSICSLGFFATQQSNSSAKLIDDLQQPQTLTSKRTAIANYLSQHKNRGKSLWKTIVTAQADTVSAPQASM